MGCCESNIDYCIDVGETFDPIIRWSSDALISIAITNITQAAPAVVTAPAHGAPEGWRVAVVSAKGMTQVNAKDFPPIDDELVVCDVLTVNTLALTTVNSADFSTYTSSGWLVYFSPVDLTGVTGTFRVWDNPNRTGTPLITKSVGSGITLDNVAKTITLLLGPTDTAGTAWTTGYYALDMIAAGETSRLLKGVLTIQ